MAHVTLPDGRELDVADGDRSLLDYYRGQGASVVLGTESATVVPQVQEDVETVADGTEVEIDSQQAEPDDAPKGKSRS